MKYKLENLNIPKFDFPIDDVTNLYTGRAAGIILIVVERNAANESYEYLPTVVPH